MEEDDFRAQLVVSGLEPYRHSTPDKTRQFVEQDIARWTPVFSFHRHEAQLSGFLPPLKKREGAGPSTIQLCDHDTRGGFYGETRMKTMPRTLAQLLAGCRVSVGA